MPNLTLKQLQTATLGQWRCAPGDMLPVDSRLCGRVVIDSRQVQPGDVFWALPGESRNGSDFVADAFSRGAAGVIVASPQLQIPQGHWSLLVDDTKAALSRVGAWQREQFE